VLRKGQRIYGEEDPSTSYQRKASSLGVCCNTCYLCPGINATKAGRWPSKRGRRGSGVVTLEQLYIPNIWPPRACREREGQEQQCRSKSRQLPSIICQKSTPPTCLRDSGPLNRKLVPTSARRSPRAAGWNCSCWRCISSTAGFVC
jgi:hypothetical protein